MYPWHSVRSPCHSPVTLIISRSAHSALTNASQQQLFSHIQAPHSPNIATNISIWRNDKRSRGKSAGIATRLRHARPRNGGPFHGRGKNFSLFLSVRTQNGRVPAFYSMCIEGPLPTVKAAAAWSWSLTSIWCRLQEGWELYLVKHPCTGLGRPCGLLEAEVPWFPDIRHMTAVRLIALRTG